MSSERLHVARVSVLHALPAVVAVLACAFGADARHGLQGASEAHAEHEPGPLLAAVELGARCRCIQALRVAFAVLRLSAKDRAGRQRLSVDVLVVRILRSHEFSCDWWSDGVAKPRMPPASFATPRGATPARSVVAVVLPDLLA